ncbi:MAG: hypothetical protein ACRYG7_21575 [Janthinobacterium lividum]
MSLNVLFLLSLYLARPAQTNHKEEAAIRQVLERESATWRAGDVAGHAACWQLRPYSRVLVSTTGGQVLDVPPARMVEPSPSMGQGGSATNANYKMHISGSTAWVSHEEESTAKDGQKTYSHEVRMLEKVAGHWKLVGQSIHQYTPLAH